MRYRNGFLCTMLAVTAAAAHLARAHEREDAGSHAAPDLDGLHVVLIRSLAPNLGGLPEYPSTWYISVRDTDGVMRDPSFAVLASLHMWPVRVMGESAAPKLNETHTYASQTVHYVIDPPVRAGAYYNVRYGFDCGVMCMGTSNAVMSHDEQGWHVVWKESRDKI